MSRTIEWKFILKRWKNIIITEIDNCLNCYLGTMLLTNKLLWRFGENKLMLIVKRYIILSHTVSHITFYIQFSFAISKWYYSVYHQINHFSHNIQSID